MIREELKKIEERTTKREENTGDNSGKKERRED